MPNITNPFKSKPKVEHGKVIDRDHPKFAKRCEWCPLGWVLNPETDSCADCTDMFLEQISYVVEDVTQLAEEEIREEEKAAKKDEKKKGKQKKNEGDK
jgi:hypothetical protein